MTSNEKIKTNVSFKDGEIKSGLTNFPNSPSLNIEGLSQMNEGSKTWSPIHLLVAAAESCFLLTFMAIANKMRAELKGCSSHAEALLSSPDGKHHEVTGVTINIKPEFTNKEDESKTAQIANIAKEYCPVANSMKDKIQIVF